MKILTTTADGCSVEAYSKHGIGCMIPSPCKSNIANIRKHCDYFCMDNGAFGAYKRGLPFMSDIFMATIKKVYDSGVSLNFLACPDIVGGVMQSLKFSLQWAHGQLVGVRDLALVVQPGMTPDSIKRDIKPFSWVFVGGCDKWKWDTLDGWVAASKLWGMRIHVGQVGTLDRLRRCAKLGVDSVDSSSYMRNKSFHIIDEFVTGHSDLFEEHRKRNAGNYTGDENDCIMRADAKGTTLLDWE